MILEEGAISFQNVRICSSKRTDSGLLWMRQWTFRFHRLRGISWLAENRLTSQEGLCSMEYVPQNTNNMASRHKGEVASLGLPFQTESRIGYHALKPHVNRINPLNPELNPICYLLALLAHHFLHVSRIIVKSLTLRLLMSYIYGAHILDVSRSHTTTQHSR